MIARVGCAALLAVAMSGCSHGWSIGGGQTIARGGVRPAGAGYLGSSSGQSIDMGLTRINTISLYDPGGSLFAGMSGGADLANQQSRGEGRVVSGQPDTREYDVHVAQPGIVSGTSLTFGFLGVGTASATPGPTGATVPDFDVSYFGIDERNAFASSKLGSRGRLTWTLGFIYDLWSYDLRAKIGPVSAWYTGAPLGPTYDYAVNDWLSVGARATFDFASAFWVLFSSHWWSMEGNAHVEFRPDDHVLFSIFAGHRVTPWSVDGFLDRCGSTSQAGATLALVLQ